MAAADDVERCLLSLLEAMGATGDTNLVDWDTVQQWLDGAFGRLLETGILATTTPARSGECRGCENRCFMEVRHLTAQKPSGQNNCADSAYGASRIILCEGWATGCTLAEDEPTALVLAAIDAGNLKPVAVAARLRWPSVELMIAGGDDRLTDDNPGAVKARAAAIAADALLALPQWPEGAPETLTDFNDLSLWLARRVEQGGDA